MATDSCFGVRHSSLILSNVETMHSTENEAVFPRGIGDGEHWATAANTC